jgi:hypothetical protein
MRRFFLLMLKILIATLPHDIPEQHAALPCIDEILYCLFESTKTLA